MAIGEIVTDSRTHRHMDDHRGPINGLVLRLVYKGYQVACNALYVADRNVYDIKIE